MIVAKLNMDGLDDFKIMYKYLIKQNIKGLIRVKRPGETSVVSEGRGVDWKTVLLICLRCKAQTIFRC